MRYLRAVLTLNILWLLAVVAAVKRSAAVAVAAMLSRVPVFYPLEYILLLLGRAAAVQRLTHPEERAAEIRLLMEARPRVVVAVVPTTLLWAEP